MEYLQSNQYCNQQPCSLPQSAKKVLLVYDHREEEAIKLDGLNVAQMKELQEKSEKHSFQAEVDRMMKLIINSLYKNKEVIKVSKCK